MGRLHDAVVNARNKLTSFTGSNHESTTLRRFCDSCHTWIGARMRINAIGRISKIVSSNNREKSKPPRQDPASKLRELSRSRHDGLEDEEAMIIDQTPTNCPRGQGERMGEGERVVEKHECRVELERDKRHVFSAWEEGSSERRGGRSRMDSSKGLRIPRRRS